jgi:hypothetical protein
MLAGTAALYPVMLVAGHIVAKGMESRPLSAVQQAAAEAERVRAEAEIAALRDQAKLEQAARRRAIAEQAPAPSARVTPAERPVERPAPVVAAPAGDLPAVGAGDDAGDGADQRVSDADLLALSVKYLRATRADDGTLAGRRALLTHLREATGLGEAITEYQLKGRAQAPGIHQRAKEIVAAEDAAPVEVAPVEEPEPVGAAA